MEMELRPRWNHGGARPGRAGAAVVIAAGVPLMAVIVWGFAGVSLVAIVYLAGTIAICPPGQCFTPTLGELATLVCAGALAGAAIGAASGKAGAGAAIGAGTGLLAGSAIGAGKADAAGGSVQARYDTVYAQCMQSRGNQVVAPPPPPRETVIVYERPEPVYVYPRPYPGYYRDGYYRRW